MSKIAELAQRLAAVGPVKTLPTPRLVQALLGGRYVLRTTESILVWEVPFYPQIYIPRSAFTGDVTVKETGAITSEQGSTIAQRLSLSAGDKKVDLAFVFSNNLTGNAALLNGLVKIDFGSLDQWFEESTPIYVHFKDPFKRVDILHSTRPIRILIDDVEVAKSSTSMHLYETGLPPRYYLPLTAIRPDVLRSSTTKTKCPYKGEAEYYSVSINGKTHEDVIWYYRQPLLESIKIEGLCCFYNEKVTIELDGRTLEQPVTPFSNRKANERPSGV